MKFHPRFGLILLLSISAYSQPTPRILTPIDDRATVRLSGNVHPLARPGFDLGPVSASEPIERMILVLKLDPAMQNELDQLVADQHNPASPLYRNWITPEEYGSRFGLADADLHQITGWLTVHGFQVEEAPNSRSTLVFSGTAGQIAETFHTQIHYYRVNGEVHRANATDPEIPASLSGVIAGIATLYDFESSHGEVAPRPISAPELTSGSTHYLAPADLATIYDVKPLYANAIDGTGGTIAVVARSNINLSDVQSFRALSALPANNPVIVLNGANPGAIAGGEQQEATLDAEWAGAIAPKAAVKFVVSASTASSDGAALSAQYIVNHNLAPVMTTSFGLCEQAAGSSYSAFWNSLWQQAAAEGITALVAAGDSGAAGCDVPSETRAGGPLAVNVIASSSYAVAVGGTQFNDTSNPSQYWSASAGTGYASALTYIPEAVWNQSGSVPGGSQLWAGAGGASTIWTRPSWQTGTGVPTDNHRHVPDVSLAASTHDAYIMYMDGGLWAVGGTSASSPTWAGIMALVIQRTAANQGNANTTLYPLMARQFSGGAAVFHDITSGNNTVPGLTGYAAGTGYDQGSGIGSPDVFLLVQHWSDATQPSLNLGLSATSASVEAGSGVQVKASTTTGGTFKSSVALAVSGLPNGLTASWAPAGIASPGAGSSALTLAASSKLAAGTYNLTVTASGEGITANASFALKVAAPPASSSKASRSSKP